MEIKDLTPGIVTPIIRQVVAEYGTDYIYKADERHPERYGVDCYYQENGQPSCIVGHVLDRAGVEYEPYWDDEGEDALTVLENAPEDLAQALQHAQYAQDDGHTWGEALTAYEEMLSGKDEKEN